VLGITMTLMNVCGRLADFACRCKCRITSHEWRRLGEGDEDAWMRGTVPLETVKRIEICRCCLSVRYANEKPGGTHGKTSR